MALRFLHMESNFQEFDKINSRPIRSTYVWKWDQRANL